MFFSTSALYCSPFLVNVVPNTGFSLGQDQRYLALVLLKYALEHIENERNRIESAPPAIKNDRDSTS